MKVNFIEKKLTLTDVLYIFKLNRNLLLIKAVSRHKVTVKFKLKSILFKHNKSVIATVNQYSSVYIIKSLSEKLVFKIQTYLNLITSLALSMTVEGDLSALKLTSELNRALSDYIVNNSATSYTIKSLKHISKNSNSLTQTQFNYLK